MLTGPRNLTYSLERHRQRKIDVRSGSLYRADSLKTVASELAKYNLDLITVQEVRWDEDGSQPTDDYTFFYGSGNANYHLGTGVFIYNGIISTLTWVKFISHKVYITLRGRWCDIVLNVHAPTEGKSSYIRNC
jgi:hypothetical protein